MDVDYSQNGEGAVIVRMFDTIGIKNGHAVDLGSGDGWNMSNVRNLIELGWSADMYDGDPKGAKDVEQCWIALSTTSKVYAECDLLNLDIDGNDYHILNSFLSFGDQNEYRNPVLIVCEINPIFERNEAKVMPYNEAHTWKGDTYYGMSLAACEHLAAQYGYTLAYLHAGINAFLLRNDHVKAHPELIRPIEYRVKHDHKPHDPKLPWITL
jgi:hypothetical protein